MVSPYEIKAPTNKKRNKKINKNKAPRSDTDTPPAVFIFPLPLKDVRRHGKQGKKRAVAKGAGPSVLH